MNRSDESRMHERARLLAADAMDGELDPRDSEWLASHMASCTECREAADEFAAIRDELRALPAPVPPRDLWARTSAGLNEVDRRRARRFLSLPRFAFASPSMVGSMVAVGIVVVLVGVSVVTQPIGGHHNDNGGTFSPGIAQTTPSPAPVESVFAIAGGDNAIVVDAKTNQMTYRSVQCTAGETCKVSDSGGAKIDAGEDPGAITAVTVDADAKQAAVSTRTSVKVVPVTSAAPAPSATASATPISTATPSSTATALSTPSQAKSSAESAPPSPIETPTSPATPVTTPVTILEGYETVGEAEFSPDGVWLAFAARPTNESAGPDVFVWHAGDTAARPITNSHAAVFSGWWHERVLLSQVLSTASVSPIEPNTPAPSAATTSTPEQSASPARSPSTSPANPQSPDASASPVPSASPAGMTYMTISYVVDPSSCASERLELAAFRPVVDPSGTRVAYWVGTVDVDQSGKPRLVSGDLQYDMWANVRRTETKLCDSGSTPGPTPSAEPSATVSSNPSASATAPEPSQKSTQTPTPDVSPTTAASPTPALPALPQRVPVAEPGELTGDWTAHWDPSGQYLGVWVADDGDATRGQLRVFGVDLTTDRLSVDTALIATPAKPGFQMTATGVIYTSPENVGDGKIHVANWPAIPVETPTATPIATGPQPTEQPGS